MSGWIELKSILIKIIDEVLQAFELIELLMKVSCKVAR